MLFFKQNDKIKQLNNLIADYKRVIEILNNQLNIYYKTTQDIKEYVDKLILDGKKHDLDAILITIMIMLREGEEDVNSCI